MGVTVTKFPYAVFKLCFWMPMGDKEVLLSHFLHPAPTEGYVKLLLE